MSSTREIVLRCLREVAPEADASLLDFERGLREQVELDSMDFFRFLVKLSTATGVPISEADYPQFATLAGAVRYLEAHAA